MCRTVDCTLCPNFTVLYTTCTHPRTCTCAALKAAHVQHVCGSYICVFVRVWFGNQKDMGYVKCTCSNVDSNGSERLLLDCDGPFQCWVWQLSSTKLGDISINPLTSVSHWSGFKVKLTFHGIQFFGSSLYTGQILEILCLQIELFLILECIWYNLGHV